METIFPELTGLASFFLNSFRRTGGALEQTGTVIVKRTYNVNPATGALAPAETALPIFESDQTIEIGPPDDRETIIQYEHDLAAIKPQGDLVVWGFVGPAGIQRLRVNGATWHSRNIVAPAGETALFGWEPRVDSTRETQGNFPDDENAYPLPEPLPAGFDNLFYNGYRRDSAVAAPFRYFLPGDVLGVERDGSVDYEVTLGPETATATYYVYSGSGPDVEARWQPHTLVMQRDTVVITPGEDACYVVWRAVWPFADHPADAYRRLEVVFDENA